MAFPHIDQQIKKFALDIKAKISADRQLVAYKKVPSQIVFYYGTVIPLLQTDQELNTSYQKGDWIVVSEDAKLPAEGSYETADFILKEENRRKNRKDILILRHSKNKDI